MDIYGVSDATGSRLIIYSVLEIRYGEDPGGTQMFLPVDNSTGAGIWAFFTALTQAWSIHLFADAKAKLMNQNNFN